jgi:hypothetical protein
MQHQGVQKWCSVTTESLISCPTMMKDDIRALYLFFSKWKVFSNPADPSVKLNGNVFMNDGYSPVV